MQPKKKILWPTIGVLAMAGSLWLFFHDLLPVPISADEELIPACNAAGKWGFINSRGRLAVSFRWDRVGAYDSSGFAKVRKEDRLGWIDRKGRMVLALQWDVPPLDDPFVPAVRGFDETNFDSVNWASVSKLAGGSNTYKFGWIDRGGREMLPFAWDNARDFDNKGMARVEKDGKWGCINREGKIVIPSEWDDIGSFDDQGMAWVKRDSRLGWINREGKTVIPLEWIIGGDFDTQGMAPAFKYHEYGIMAGFINRAGKIVIPLEWDNVGAFDAQGMAWTIKNGKWGFINREGKVVIPLEWDPFLESHKFDEKDMALVCKGGDCGWINRTGEVVIPMRFQNAWHFDQFDGAWVEENGSLGRVNRKGDFMINPSTLGFAIASADADHGFLTLENKGKELVGCVDRNGTWIIPPAPWVIYIAWHPGEKDRHFNVLPGKDFWTVTAKEQKVLFRDKLWHWAASKLPFIPSSPLQPKDVPYCAVYDKQKEQVIWTSNDRSNELWWGTGMAVLGAGALAKYWRQRRRR